MTYLFSSGCSEGMNGLAAIADDTICVICDMFDLAKINNWSKALEIRKLLFISDS